MAARRIAGSIRQVSLAGTVFHVMADSNISMPPSAWENSNIPTSGPNMRRMVRRSQNIEGLVLACTADDLAALKLISESLDNITMSVTNAAGDTLRAEGTVNLESHETEENRTAVQLLPENEWTTSVAEVS
jgi:outer membrane lipopolysaccharide assembly protein LptE/RlpB